MTDEKNMQSAALKLTACISLIKYAEELKAVLIKRADTGRMNWEQEALISLDMLESLSGLFDSTISIEDHIENSRHELGLDDEDEDDRTAAELYARFKEGRDEGLYA